jgi:bifunctional non-homologous end joining protein LigD
MDPGATLPRFIPPMLAKAGKPFDSTDFLFEVKWDGTRCLCFVDDRGLRLVNRRQFDLTHRYPELAHLAKLPSGTVLDGELVVLKEGKPDFGALQSREHSRSPRKIALLAKTVPATYIVFDLLYEAGKPLLNEPLTMRRERLERLLTNSGLRNVVLSEGVIGAGHRLFEETTKADLEGVVAKRLNSRYLPGKRTDAWIKIKRGVTLFCVVIGYEPSGKKDFRNLIVAREVDGEMRVAGKVGSGFSDNVRERVAAWLLNHERAKPVIRCRHKGKWVEPGLVCRVSCMELTAAGEMRAPVFHEIVRD